MSAISVIVFLFILIILGVSSYFIYNALKKQDCKVSEWSTYSECSKKCDGGNKTRTRQIITPVKNGGTACPLLEDSVQCNMQECDVDCVVSDWPDYGVCSKPCGGGTQSRIRTIIKNKKGNGKACPILSEEKSCNEEECVKEEETKIEEGTEKLEEGTEKSAK
jgi:hypothetical protein